MKESAIKKCAFSLATTLSLLVLLATTVLAADDSAALKEEINNLKNKVMELEQKLDQQSQPNQVMQQNRAIQQPQIVRPMGPWGLEEEWNPLAEMEQMQQQMNRMFNNSFWRGYGNNNYLDHASNFDPTTDIHETKDEYIVKLDIPGMEKNEINIEVKDGHLVISGEKKTDKEENNKNKFYRRERSFGYFSRVVALPENANPEKVSAEYLNGIVTVKIGKLAVAPKGQPVKKVEIK